MFTKVFLSISIMFCFPVFASSQNPFIVAPRAYKLQFENDWLKVTRVHYGPHVKIPAHDHSRWPAAYVYLNNSGPIIFRHVGWNEPVLTRPATKDGSFRLSPTSVVDETHEVENPTKTPSDFLRIEFKTEPVGRESLHGRYYRDGGSISENLQIVQFENEQLRVTRIVCAPNKSLDILTASNEPALLVMLTANHLKFTEGQGAGKLIRGERGRTYWLDGGRQEEVENLSKAPVEILRFDLRTAPVREKGGK